MIVSSDQLFEKINSWYKNFILSSISSRMKETIDSWAICMVAWQKSTFFGENIYELYPNLYDMRGTKYIAVSLWIDSLDKLHSFKALYMVPSHTRPSNKTKGEGMKMMG